MTLLMRSHKSVSRSVHSPLAFCLLWCCSSITGIAQTKEAVPNEVSPNIGHSHHLHRYGSPRPVLPASAANERFFTSRVGTKELKIPATENSGEEEFSFVIFGDRTGGPVDGVSVLANAVHDANLLDPDLVMTVGDLVNGYNKADQWIEQMTEYQSIMSQLNSPWFPVPGNHDIYWRGGTEETYPKGGNSTLYEEHFGPLWYAFEHKNCWFITLYADEGDPETGEQTFGNPSAQKLSQEQFEWLNEALKKASRANHVFVFLHHPRWQGGGYGNDWERVHQRLVEARNVSAVFAGHIHDMKYFGVKDGIEYVTLATTGGSLPPGEHAVNRVHHIDTVKVRKDQISIAALPVSSTIDVREITVEVSQALSKAKNLPVTVKKPLDLPPASKAKGFKTTVELEIQNPTTLPLQVEVSPVCHDRRWALTLSESKFELAAEQTQKFTLEARYFGENAPNFDANFDLPELRIQSSLQLKGARYDIPVQHAPLEVNFIKDADSKPTNHALQLNGNAQFIAVPSRLLSIPNTFTIECRFKGEDWQGRQGIVTKTQESDYGILAQGQQLQFIIHIDGAYVTLASDKNFLQPNEWYHVAGVYDGKEARLYVNGKLLAKKEKTGKRKKNDLPLIIGGDTDKPALPVDFFRGTIDEVRLSRGVRYVGENADAPAKPKHTDLLHYTFDEQYGDYHLDLSPSRFHTRAQGRPQLMPVP